MDYTATRQRVIGFLDEIRRDTDDVVFDRALQRVTSIAVWILDQNRYKPDVTMAELRELVMEEIDLYLQKMIIDLFGDQALYDAVVRSKELVDQVFQELIAEEEKAAADKATV